MVRVEILRELRGRYNGKPWPAIGETMALSKADAASLIAQHAAVIVEDDDKAEADKAAAEKAAAEKAAAEKAAAEKAEADKAAAEKATKPTSAKSPSK